MRDAPSRSLNRAVVAFVLLGGGLLLLGGLLAAIEDDIDTETILRNAGQVEPKGNPQAAERMADFLEFDAIELPHDLEIEIPEGSHVDWDAGSITLGGDVEITVPAGTSITNLTLRLPPGSQIQFGPESRTAGAGLILGPGTQIRLDPQYGAYVFSLPRGGVLAQHGMHETTVRDALRAGSMATPRWSDLDAPLAVTVEDWDIRLHSGQALSLDGLAPILGGLEETEGNQSITLAAANGQDDDEATPLSAGQGGTDGGAATRGPTSAPPWWAWALVGAAMAAIAGATGARRIPALLQRRPPPFNVTVTLGERPRGLPLALAPGQATTMHVHVQPKEPHPQALETERRPRLRVTLEGHGTLARQDVPAADGVPIDLPALAKGDHAVTLYVKTHPLRRAYRFDETIRAAAWSEQIARDYEGLVDRLRERAPALAQGATPRQVLRCLKGFPTVPMRHAQHVIQTLEESNYSGGAVDEDRWVRFAVRQRTLTASLRPRAQAGTRAPRALQEPADRTATTTG